ncbi:radical SAM protein [Aeromonas veronii]|uniref:radical SAM protein n=1 Tax=Aeromonas veronii TaxID=654 RepID=UPI001116BDEC|nr:radical SAM protein [Aeromonas veronii]TNI04355.1 hypothetical protein CF135_15760 [Aeromonas veronii]HDO1312615.1 radical SAM protein [Aeromonas veronii]
MLHTANIHLTNKCNRLCSHCLFKSGVIETKIFDAGKWVEFFKINRNAFTLSAKINIFGGEPTLYKDLDHLIHSLANMEFDVGLTTNATASFSKIKKLISLGLNRVSLDISSINPDSHNHLKPRTFEKTIKLLEKLDLESINVWINIVIHDGNKDEIESILEFISSYNIKGVSLFSLTKIGMALENHLMALSSDEWLSLRRRIEVWHLSYKPEFILSYENSYLEHPSENNYKICAIKDFHEINIRSDGNVYHCCLLMAIDYPLGTGGGGSLGNVFHDKLSGIFKKRHKMLFERERLCPAINLVNSFAQPIKNYWCPYDCDSFGD